MNNICATVLAVLLSAAYSVMLGKSDKIVKPGETTVIGCINNTHDKIWSYRRNINVEITLMEGLAVNPDYKDKLKWTFNVSVGEYCLNIINVSSQDEGTYRCYTQGHTLLFHFNLCIEDVTSPEPVAVNKSVLQISLNIVLGKSDKIVKPGETIVLGCINGTDDTIWSYRQNINDDRITLMDTLVVNPKYKEKVKLTSKGTSGEYCLNIINVSSQDEGVYYRFTKAQNSFLQFNLAIEVAPDGLIILNKTTNGIIIEMEDKMLNVTCQVIGGNTKGKIYWRNVSDFEPHFTEVDAWPFSYLHFTTDYKHHKINLSCVVEHAMLIVPMVTSVIFDIRYKPKITISRYPAGVIKEGQGIELECLDKSNPPKANITWVKDGIILSSDPIYEKTNMKTNDSGSYSCIVFNSLGKEVQDIVIFVNRRNGRYNDDFLDLKSFLCFGIFTLSFVLLVASAICNICIHLHCKKLSRVSSLTVNNDVSRVNIEMTDINNGYHTINEEDIRQEDNEDENQAEIQSTNDLSLIDFDGQSSELDADETGLRESNDYVNPYCTMIQDTVEVHTYKTLCVRNSDSDNTAVNLNTELQRSYENLKF